METADSIQTVLTFPILQRFLWFPMIFAAYYRKLESY